MKRHKQNQRGFTIIETLIVLAIAGLILLIVFEAIPTLERNSRNNQRRQDVNAILEAVSHYELEDSGNFPLNCDGSPHACTSSAGSNSPNNYFLEYSKSKLTYYTDTTQVILKSQHARQTETNLTGASNDDVYIYNYQKCDTSQNGQPTWQGAGYNDVVALYAIESGGNNYSKQCEQL